MFSILVLYLSKKFWLMITCFIEPSHHLETLVISDHKSLLETEVLSLWSAVKCKVDF